MLNCDRMDNLWTRAVKLVLAQTCNHGSSRNSRRGELFGDELRVDCLRLRLHSTDGWDADRGPTVNSSTLGQSAPFVSLLSNSQ